MSRESVAEAKLPSDPFRVAGLRLTRRTAQVLGAIADTPGASNRAIADAAAIRDQGQISRLLTRLQRAGMIANSALTPAKGASNSWYLTDDGRQVAAAIGAWSTRGRTRSNRDQSMLSMSVPGTRSGADEEGMG